MRSDIGPGGVLPDYSLPDHAGLDSDRLGGAEAPGVPV